jgi:hypothetical protein
LAKLELLLSRLPEALELVDPKLFTREPSIFESACVGETAEPDLFAIPVALGDRDADAIAVPDAVEPRLLPATVPRFAVVPEFVELRAVTDELARFPPGAVRPPIEL